MKITIILIALLIIPVRAHTSDWTKNDTKRELVYMAFHAADWRQTIHISKHPTEHSEKNKFLGSAPSQGKVNRYFVSTAIAHYAVSKALPRKWRKVWQYVTIGFEGGIVAGNYSLGIKINL